MKGYVNEIKIKRLLPNGNMFFSTLIRLICSLYNIRSEKMILLLIEFSIIASKNNGKLLLTTYDRRVICEKIGISLNYLCTLMKRLEQMEIISGSHGNYKLDTTFKFELEPNENYSFFNNPQEIEIIFKRLSKPKDIQN